MAENKKIKLGFITILHDLEDCIYHFFHYPVGSVMGWRDAKCETIRRIL